MKKFLLISILLSPIIAGNIIGSSNLLFRRNYTYIQWTTYEPYRDYPCKMEEVDSQVYCKQWRQSDIVDWRFPFAKRRGEIKVKCQNKNFIFRDDLSDSNYHEFFSWGQFKQWLIVYGQDYHQQRFYMISLNTDSLTSLIGEPRIYGDKILCVEGDYADSPLLIELWQMNSDGLNMLFCKSLRSLGLHGIQDWFYSNGHIFLKNNVFVNNQNVITFYDLIIQ